MARKRTRGERQPRASLWIEIPPGHLARVRLLRYASQLLYGRHGYTWAEVLEHGVVALEERVKADASARGYPLDKLYADAGAMLARRRRVDRGEAEPLEYGAGLIPPGQAKPAKGGYGSLGIRPGAS